MNERISVFNLNRGWPNSIACTLATLILLFSSGANASCPELLDFTVKKLRSGEEINFCDRFSGKTLLVVNTASQCGYTSQFAGLEELYQSKKGELEIVGFPSNDFRQEYSDQDKVAEVCFINYGVTFTMVEPSSVKGTTANSFFQKLSLATGKQPQWNFNKYLISPDGDRVLHFPSGVAPDSDQLHSAIDNISKVN